jgi:estrone sulfotransferase
MTLPTARAAANALRRHRAPAHPYLFARVRPSDTYLVSFPRSGNTWLRSLLTALVHDEPITPELIQSTIPDVHRSDRSQAPPGRWGLIKSHTPFVEMPARVVYLVRDGRDAMLSYHAHQVALGRLDPGDGPGPFLRSNDVWPCPWPQHVQGWLDGLATRPKGRSLVLRYEDLTADTAEGLARVAELVGLPTSASRIARAVRRADIGTLQAAETSAGPGSLNLISTPHPRWPAGVSAADASWFMESAGPVLQRLGYDVGQP